MRTFKGQEEVEGVLMDVFEIKNGSKTHTVKERVKTEADLIEQVKLDRILELEILIPRMKLLGDDVTELQAEFRTLTGL